MGSRRASHQIAARLQARARLRQRRLGALRAEFPQRSYDAERESAALVALHKALKRRLAELDMEGGEA